MPTRYPVLRGVLNRRMLELQMMMLGIPSEEVYSLSDFEIERDLKLIAYLTEKQNGRSD